MPVPIIDSNIINGHSGNRGLAAQNNNYGNVSFAQFNSSIVSIYPNPTNGVFNISCPKAGTLRMYNMEGQQTGTYTVNSGTTQLQLPSGFSAGIYRAASNQKTE